MSRAAVHRALAALHEILADPSALWPDDIRSIESTVSVLEGLKHHAR